MAGPPTVLVLGGTGEAGRRIARLWLQRQEGEVRIASRSLERGQSVADSLNANLATLRAKAVRVDLYDIASVRKALEGVRLVFQAGPALPEEALRQVAEEVVDAGAHWVDLQLASSQIAALRPLEDRLRRRNLCFASQAGFHPGLPAALVRWAGSRVDELTSARVASYLNPRDGLLPTSGMDELMELFQSYDAQVFEEGRWRSATGTKRRDMKRFRFPFGVGRRTCVVMGLDEMYDLPGMFPALTDTGFFIGNNDRITSWIVTPLMMLGMRLFPRVPLSTWGRLYCRSTKKFARPPWGTVLLLEAEGRKGGDRVTVRLGLRHEDEYEFTAAPAVAVGEQILNRVVRCKGVRYAAHVPDAQRLLRDLVAMGIEQEWEVDSPAISGAP